MLILRELHWLPVQERIQHKLLSNTYQSVHGNTPLNLSDFHIYMQIRVDISLIVPGPGSLRQSNTASEPSGMSLPLSGMPYLEAST